MYFPHRLHFAFTGGSLVLAIERSSWDEIIINPADELIREQYVIRFAGGRKIACVYFSCILREQFVNLVNNAAGYRLRHSLHH